MAATQAEHEAMIAAYTELFRMLDEQGHSEECVWRCLNMNCESDHACAVCGDDEEDE